MSEQYRTPQRIIDVQVEPGDNGGSEQRFVHGLPLAVATNIADTASRLATIITSLSSISGFVDGIETKLDAIAANQAPPSAAYHNGTNVTTAGTRVVLAASQALTEGVWIRGKDANTGLIYIGGATVSSTNGDRLTAKERVFIRTNNLANVYIDSAVNGEGVTYVGW